MSDRMGAEITIGGQLKIADTAKLLTAINADGPGLEWGQSGGDYESLDEVTGEDGTICLMDDEARIGEFESIESTCRELGLTYVRKSEGRYEHNPEIAWWQPGMQEPAVVMTNTDHELTVNHEQIEPIVKLLEKGKTDKALEALKRLFPEIPKVPDLEVVDG